MSLSLDVIKIQLSQMGYLPDWPPHLMSLAEMCDAFLVKDTNDKLHGYFIDAYPCVTGFEDPYNTLCNSILRHLNWAKFDTTNTYEIPDWVASYMLGSVVGPTSNTLEIHDLLVSLGCDNMDDIFTPTAASRCYEVSQKWIQKYLIYDDTPEGKQLRPPTIFGELHVIKSLRIHG